MAKSNDTAAGAPRFEPRRIVVCGPGAVEAARLTAPDLAALTLPHKTIVVPGPSVAGAVALSTAHAVVYAAGPGADAAASARADLAVARLLSPTPLRFVLGPAAAAAARSATDEAPALDGIDPRPYELPGDAPALAQALVSSISDHALATLPLRVWIAATERPHGTTVRVLARVVSGTVRIGSDVVALPSGVSAKVTAIEPTANDGIVHLTLEGPAQSWPEAGDLLCETRSRAELADQVAAEIIWTGATPMLPGRPYTVRIGPQSAGLQISLLKHRLNPETLEPLAARKLSAGEIGTCNLSFARPLAFDDAAHDPLLSRFDILDGQQATPVGHGVIRYTLRRATNIHWQSLAVGRAERARLKGQTPCCLWLTGLSGSGKSTVASLLEKRLTAAGRHTYTLDGDNVRHGLNRDLGFTDADRVENIRRVGEVARLFVDAGLIVMVSFISPFRAERRMVRDLFTSGDFIEIFVDTPLAMCEARDVKGLYRKARAGTLKNFTGIDSPYERPDNPDVHLDGATLDPEAMVEQVCRELERRGIV